MAKQKEYVPFQQQHGRTCQCNVCNKAQGCTIVRTGTGRINTYNVTSAASGRTYQTVANRNGTVSCNCQCGQNRHNSPCAHAERTRWEEKERVIPALTAQPAPALDSFNDDLPVDEDVFVF